MSAASVYSDVESKCATKAGLIAWIKAKSWTPVSMPDLVRSKNNFAAIYSYQYQTYDMLASTEWVYLTHSFGIFAVSDSGKLYGCLAECQPGQVSNTCQALTKQGFDELSKLFVSGTSIFSTQDVCPERYNWMQYSWQLTKFTKPRNLD